MKITKELLAKTLHESLYGEGGELAKDSQDPNDGVSYLLAGPYESAPEKYRKHMEIAAQRAIDLMEEEPLTDGQHMEYIRENWIRIKNYVPKPNDDPDAYFIITGVTAKNFVYDYLVVHPGSSSFFAMTENNSRDGVDTIFRVYPGIDYFISANPSDFNLYAKDLLDVHIKHAVQYSLFR